MRTTSVYFSNRIASALGVALIAGLSAPLVAQEIEQRVRAQDQEAPAPAQDAAAQETMRPRVFNPDGPAIILTDEALVETDPDFAWRKSWSEAPNWGGRMGYVDAEGTLRVKLRYYPEGTQGANWAVVAKDVADFQLMDWRIAVRKTDGSLWFANGQLSEPLKKIDDDVAAYQMTLIDIGTLSTEGAFRYSEGGPARTIATGVKAFQMQHTGRMGVLGNDGGLWLFEGGRPHGDAFKKMAQKVKSFQLEREWVAYIEEGPEARLMVAKGEHVWRNPLSFSPVASGVEDFEGEITVAFTEGFPSRLHVAAVGKGGAILYGEAAEPAKLAFVSVGSGAKEVHWAGQQLAVLGPRGDLRIASFTNDGQLQGFQSYGHAESFRLTVERALLVARTPNEVSIVSPRLVEEPEPAGQEKAAAKLDKDGHPLGKSMRVEGLDMESERYLVEGKNGEETFAASFELSSIRPSFQRRAMTAPVAPKGELLPLAFSK